ncbi:MAG TPA: DUF4124 domain-containing protein [Rhodanobacteraceae bacterium]|nr:DUF4124 domain-containing protein [Rhodanobacteraceae bacterium]
MQMRSLLAASVMGLSLACAAGLANAQQVYKWKDANGVVHFSQTPPATGTHYSKMRLSSGPGVSSSPPPAATQEADGEGDDAPRQTLASGSQPEKPSSRAQLCRQLSSNIGVLQGQQPVVASSNGKQVVMSDSAREQQLANARAQQAQFCSQQGS